MAFLAYLLDDEVRRTLMSIYIEPLAKNIVMHMIEEIR